VIVVKEVALWAARNNTEFPTDLHQITQLQCFESLDVHYSSPGIGTQQGIALSL
jgi:hypothetical protein